MSLFSQDKSKRNYFQDGISFLEAIGLDAERFMLIGHATSITDEYVNAAGETIIPIGWAFCRKNWQGEKNNLEQIIRVKEYWPEGFDGPAWVPTVGWNGIYWNTPANEIAMGNGLIICNDPLIGEFVKTKYNLPVVSLYGQSSFCFADKQYLLPDIIHAITSLPNNGFIRFMYIRTDFDTADLETAANNLRDEIFKIRPDLRIELWQHTAPELADITLNNAIVEFTESFVRGADGVMFLIQQCGLIAEKTKDGKINFYGSLSNYCKILTFPYWAGYYIDFNGIVYHGRDTITGGVETVRNEFQKWVEQIAPEHRWNLVNLQNAFEMWSNDHRCVCLVEAMKALPIPSYDPFLELTKKDGAMPVVVPNAETAALILKKLFVGLIALWLKPIETRAIFQYIFVLIGPSGCGKTTFFHNITKWYFGSLPVGTMPKNIYGISETEIVKMLAASLILCIDEYVPNDKRGRDFELKLFTASSESSQMIRASYARFPSLHVNMAIPFITTTSANRQFIRTGKDEGGRRRYAVIEIAKKMNFPELEKLGPQLWAYAYKLYKQGFKFDDLENYTAQYIDAYYAQSIAAIFAAGIDPRAVLQFIYNHHINGSVRAPIVYYYRFIYGKAAAVNHNNLTELETFMRNHGAKYGRYKIRNGRFSEGIFSMALDDFCEAFGVPIAEAYQAIESFTRAPIPDIRYQPLSPLDDDQQTMH